MPTMDEKIAWQRTLVSVQPRIRLTRSFDQRSHSYLGYALRVQGTIGGEEREFLVGIGKAAHAKHPRNASNEQSTLTLLATWRRLELPPGCEQPPDLTAV